MFKLSALIATAAVFFSSYLSGFTVPRILHGTGDYLLMPLLGYFMIIVVAQLAARVVPQPKH